MIDDRPIQVVQGEQPLLNFTFMLVDVLTKQLVPHDVSTKTIRFTVRQNGVDVVSYLSTDVSSRITRVAGTTNSIRVQIGTAATAVPAPKGMMRYFLTLITEGFPSTARMGSWIVVDF